MTIKPKGGYKDPAPYQTTHVRVPVPLKPAVEELVNQYRQMVLTGQMPAELPDEVTNKVYVDKVIDIVCSILRRKKSAKQSFIMLLTRLYGIDINSEEL